MLVMVDYGICEVHGSGHMIDSNFEQATYRTHVRLAPIGDPSISPPDEDCENESDFNFVSEFAVSLGCARPPPSPCVTL